ncbi:TIGR01777 family oxidoreductase [Candidatus Bipolaricaulota bacterium]
MMRAVITGATGLIGSRLVREFSNPVVLSRDPARAKARLGDGVSVFTWLPESSPAPAEAFADVDVVFHLAGEPIGEGRLTARRRRAILDSRVNGTRNLISSLKSVEKRPTVLVAASAVGYYGDRGDETLTESSAAASTFLAEVCQAWEAESMKAKDLGLRVVVSRTGIVLAPEGGALKRMLPPFRFCLGGVLGNGRQWMSWVHIDDVIGLLLHAARNGAVHGPMNVVSPNPVTNKTFTRTLGHVLRRPAVLKVPTLGLKIAFGELSQLLLSSQRVLPQVARDTGYQFAFDKLEHALETCVLRSAHPRASSSDPV